MKITQKVTQKKAIVVNVIPHNKDKKEAEEEFEELIRLVETYGGIVILKILQKRGRPSAKTFLGGGKAHEVAQMAKDMKADIVIVNDFLRANQSNNLVNIIPCEVLDRFELILLIFEKHAASPEAKLQIELMRMKYEFPKLFGKGAFLAQQRGGAQAARGPGEKLLEFKRRHLKNRIHQLEEKLEQFVKIRRQQRDRRKRQNFFSVAIVGYTNSGKSTLLQSLTRKQNIRIEDKLFSTLDTRLGEIYVPPNGAEQPKILISDTIGFIQNLPPLLFKTFIATLEEVKEADLIIHVIDIADPNMEQKITVVDEVLRQLECGAKDQIYVFNKIDILGLGLDETNMPQNSNLIETLYKKYPGGIFISAQHKLNLDKLILKIAKEAVAPHAALTHSF